MITIDYALRVYTDKLNFNESIDLEYFKENLSVDDFVEFQELIPFIGLFKSATRVTPKFEVIFDKVHKRKEEIYDLPSAANFRADKGAVNEEIKKKVDAIFDEEFGDE